MLYDTYIGMINKKNVSCPRTFTEIESILYEIKSPVKRYTYGIKPLSIGVPHVCV